MGGSGVPGRDSGSSRIGAPAGRRPARSEQRPPASYCSLVSIGSSSAADQLKLGALSGAPVVGS
ncbi:hypothetical protein GCM10010207_59930 [Streptomyces atratus]|nr:hypothetical protein GCM10010207_59930 [Streptomyces atratus]